MIHDLLAVTQNGSWVDTPSPSKDAGQQAEERLLCMPGLWECRTSILYGECTHTHTPSEQWQGNCVLKEGHRGKQALPGGRAAPKVGWIMSVPLC